ncbi:sulfotransferase [Phenylobacterium sp.]|uniref:tetratricopeptide repeat-containing sulfotransferase family protein n=1 Tax=Phenylobacterium sp. TaxID=1871053 RepID=UPI0035B1CFC0
MTAAATPPNPPLAAAAREALRLLQARRPGQALAVLAALPAEQQGAPAALALTAYAHSLAGAFDEALRAARRCMSAPAGLDLMSMELAGLSFTLCHRPAEAYEVFRRAAELAPDNPSVLHNLAATARFMGRANEAEDAYDRLLARLPADWPAWRNRSELRRQTAERNHVEALKAALARAPAGEPQAQLAYALGKELEDLGDFAGAFASFRRGAEARRARMRYDVAADAASVDLIGEVFDAEWCRPGRAGAAGAGPIFILGMPRAGSTLLESLIGRHSQVQPLGELQSFGSAVVGAVLKSRPAPPADKDALIRAAREVDPAAIGRAYLDAVRPLRDERAWFTDKLPINFLYAGLIARALPQARIVHIRRTPIDACMAIYKTLFDEAYPFSYDLAELGRYYGAYLRLMDHWREALGERLIELSYEDLVGAPNAVVARVLGRIGLPPEAVTEAAGAAPVMTASASQVREPIHDRSLAAIRSYLPYLGELEAALAEAGASVKGAAR